MDVRGNQPGNIQNHEAVPGAKEWAAILTWLWWSVWANVIATIVLPGTLVASAIRLHLEQVKIGTSLMDSAGVALPVVLAVILFFAYGFVTLLTVLFWLRIRLIGPSRIGWLSAMLVFVVLEMLISVLWMLVHLQLFDDAWVIPDYTPLTMLFIGSSALAFILLLGALGMTFLAIVRWLSAAPPTRCL